MNVKFLHVVASWSQILAWVELGGFLGEGFADGGGHGQTAVRVDVDLADCALGCLAELFLWDTDSGFQAATVFVDGVDLFLWYG